MNHDSDRTYTSRQQTNRSYTTPAASSRNVSSSAHLRDIRHRVAMSSPSDTPPSSPGSDFIAPEDDAILRSGDPWEPSQRPQRPQYASAKTSRSRLVLCSVFVASAIVVAATLLALRDRIYIATLRRSGVPPGLWSKDGVLHVGKDPFSIKGLSWYGMEEPQMVPGGLQQLPLEDIFQFITDHNFNAIRVPLAVDNIHDNKYPREGISTIKNPQLMDRDYLGILAHIIREAASRDILVLLDAHRLSNNEIPEKTNGLWHSSAVPEDKLFDAWRILCERFSEEWNVMGADIFNEPHNASWGSNDVLEDWKIAAERMTEDIHKSCPSWLIMIQGVANKEKTKEPTFWAENLNPMHDAPPEATLSQKVSLSPHVYGPGTYMQSYFKKEDFTDDMPAIWDDHFGLASEKTGYATIVGEWGGDYLKKDEKWQQRFLQYMLDKQMSSFYWCLNPESADTGGLLKDGWSPEEDEKLALLEPLPSSSVADNAIHFQLWRDWRTQ